MTARLLSGRTTPVALATAVACVWSIFVPAVPGVMPGVTSAFAQVAQKDDYEKQLDAEAIAATNRERVRQLREEFMYSSAEYVAQMTVLQNKWDLHQVLKLETAVKDGALVDAAAIADEWERNQTLTNREIDPEIAQKMKNLKPHEIDIAKLEYSWALETCDPSNALVNAGIMAGEVRKMSIIAPDDPTPFPNFLRQHAKCANLAPLFLQFEAEVEAPHSFSKAQANIRLSFDSSYTPPGDPGYDPALRPTRYVYTALHLPLEYVSYRYKTDGTMCSHGDGVSGTVDATVLILGDPNRPKPIVTVNVVPTLEEKVIEAMRKGRSCKDYTPYRSTDFSTGFRLTTADGPFQGELGNTVTIEPRPVSKGGDTWKSKVVFKVSQGGTG